MQTKARSSGSRLFTNAWLFLPSILVIIMSCQKSITNQQQDEIAQVQKTPQSLKDLEQVNLIANNDKYGAARVDANLINGWGISFASNANGTTWISSEGQGVSLVVNKEGGQAIAPVAIPSPSASTGGHPSGQVFNGGTGFRLPNGTPARFIFAGLDGVISGWNGGSAAIKKVDDSPDAVYSGITIAADGIDTFLYVANFSERKIDVYDTAWAEVSKPFIDNELPSGYSPFNIQNINGKLYVMYAKVGPDGDEIKHQGFGIVDVYNPDGSLMKRFLSNGQLDAPWGVAKAPAGFWGNGNSDIQNVILVGNFGDGRINAFDANGHFLGQLRSHGNPIVIEGLWAITFPPATATAIDPGRLYFAAGPADEEDGLFGYIDK